MSRLPPRYGLRVLVAVLALAAYGVVFAFEHSANSMFVTSLSFMVALGLGGWALGRVGGTVMGAVFMDYSMLLARLFNVDMAAYWGTWGSPFTPTVIAGYTLLVAGIGWLVGAAGDFSREARYRAAQVAAKNRELEAATARLAQSEEMFRAFAERIDVGAWIRPTDGKKGYVNEAARKLLGPVGEDPATAASAFLKRVHPIDQAAVDASRRALERGEIQDVEFRVLEGTHVRWLRTQTFPILDASGATSSFVGLVEDITDRKEREARREVLERRERLSSLGSLVAGVAHEVNNPLTYLVGNVALAKQEIARAAQATPDQAADAAQRLQRADKLLTAAAGGGERIARIVKALRAVTQHRSDAERSLVDLNALATNVAELMNVNLPHEVKIELHLDAAREPRVRARSDELHQVVLNLATNAVQALRGRGGHVLLETSVEGDRAVLRVTDDGPGMSEETRLKLFTPFFTTKTDGTGLGLSIAHGIVRDHDGDIEVDTRVGVGTAFIVRFPLAPATAEAPHGAAPAAAAPAATVLKMGAAPS